MNQEEKNLLLEEARAHVSHIQEVVREQGASLKNLIERNERNRKDLGRSDQMVHNVLRNYNERRQEELESMIPSPYFSRCDFCPSGELSPKTLYFGKFTLPEESMYSWVSPISSLRFENPGTASYKKPKEKIQTGELLRKDQYRIVNGNIQFFAMEKKGEPRELLYQEHFSNRKTGFVLPEIVAQMEKAQDQVIRADHRGPFVLSGPAGSGKTTLALHRVAYLVQSPETAELFQPRSIAVFVQDTGTKKYFSKLLPELGIHDVHITTFSEWAFEILDLDGYEYVICYGESEQEQDYYEYAKNKVLKNIPEIPFRIKNIYPILENMYTPYFSPELLTLWKSQRKEKKLDRFDITILLQLYLLEHGKLTQEREYYLERKNGSYQKKKGKMPVEYTLAIADEFQNYLPLQLTLIQSTLLGREKSLIYVGDMAQQVQIGTLKQWSEIGENITEERKVMLQKVYRNTKYILEYISELGFSVSIPEGLRIGIPVKEIYCEKKSDEIKNIEQMVARTERGSIGILSKDRNYLKEFEEKFRNEKDVYCLSMSEAQGVEFDIVCIVGIDEKTFRVDYSEEKDLEQEKQKIYRDLLYVALTRAMNELFVFGNTQLKESLAISKIIL